MRGILPRGRAAGQAHRGAKDFRAQHLPLRFLSRRCGVERAALSHERFVAGKNTQTDLGMPLPHGLPVVRGASGRDRGKRQGSGARNLAADDRWESVIVRGSKCKTISRKGAKPPRPQGLNRTQRRQDSAWLKARLRSSMRKSRTESGIQLKGSLCALAPLRENVFL